MINEIYKLRYLNSYISDISTYDTFSSTGKIFKSLESVYEFLIEAQIKNLQAGKILNINKYEIVKFTTNETHIGTMPENQLTKILISNDPGNNDIIYSIIKYAVLNGFNTIEKELYNFLLTNEKYASIMNKLIPVHMLNCMDQFYDVGLKTCDIDILGSIYLTSTPEQIIMYNMDDLFI